MRAVVEEQHIARVGGHGPRSRGNVLEHDATVQLRSVR